MLTFNKERSDNLTDRVSYTNFCLFQNRRVRINIVDEYSWNTGFQQRLKKKKKLLQQA